MILFGAAMVTADFEYDNGYGGTYIPMELVVVGNDFWLERSEYDGAEGWDFKTMPARPFNKVSLFKTDLTEMQLYDEINEVTE